MQHETYSIQRKKLFVASATVLATILVVSAFEFDNSQLRLISDYGWQLPVVLLPLLCLFIGFGTAIVMQQSDFGKLSFIPILAFLATAAATSAAIIIAVICTFTDAGSGQQWWTRPLECGSGLLGIYFSGRISWDTQEVQE